MHKLPDNISSIFGVEVVKLFHYGRIVLLKFKGFCFCFYEDGGASYCNVCPENDINETYGFNDISVVAKIERIVQKIDFDSQETREQVFLKYIQKVLRIFETNLLLIKKLFEKNENGATFISEKLKSQEPFMTKKYWKMLKKL